MLHQWQRINTTWLCSMVSPPQQCGRPPFGLQAWRLASACSPSFPSRPLIRGFLGSLPASSIQLWWDLLREHTKQEEPSRKSSQSIIFSQSAPLAATEIRGSFIRSFIRKDDFLQYLTVTQWQISCVFLIASSMPQPSLSCSNRDTEESTWHSERASY